jgi:hypothetical protein
MRAHPFFAAVAFMFGFTLVFTELGWAQEKFESTNQQVTMTWPFKNNHPNIVYMQLYAVQGRRVYPGSNQYYKLDDSAAHNSRINCWAGEKICYGAWTTGGIVWGVGQNNSRSCQNCCVTCQSGNIRTIDLNPP